VVRAVAPSVAMGTSAFGLTDLSQEVRSIARSFGPWPRERCFPRRHGTAQAGALLAGGHQHHAGGLGFGMDAAGNCTAWGAEEGGAFCGLFSREVAGYAHTTWIVQMESGSPIESLTAPVATCGSVGEVLVLTAALLLVALEAVPFLRQAIALVGNLPAKATGPDPLSLGPSRGAQPGPEFWPWCFRMGLIVASRWCSYALALQLACGGLPVCSGRAGQPAGLEPASSPQDRSARTSAAQRSAPEQQTNPGSPRAGVWVPMAGECGADPLSCHRHCLFHSTAVAAARGRSTDRSGW